MINNLFSLKPINRRGYFNGLVFLFIIILLSFFGFFVFRPFSELTNIIFFLIYPILIFLDYRRILDISSEKIYLLVVLIPIINVLFKLISLGEEESILMQDNPAPIVLFEILNFVLTVFLLFKKGQKKEV